jgi:hypothetical protein
MDQSLVPAVSGAHFIHFVDANDQTWLENHHHIIITSKSSKSSISRIWKTSGWEDFRRRRFLRPFLRVAL